MGTDLDNRGSDTIAALETAWGAIRAKHPDVSADVVFVIGNGVRKGGIALGSVTVHPNLQDHRAQSSRAKSDPGKYHTVFIASQTLSLHPVKLLETLIHEAVHTIAATREIQDTSRQYRYHNRKFRTLCEEAGLSWEHVDYKRVKNPETGIPEYVANPDYTNRERVDMVKNPLYLTCEAKADELLGYSDMTITEDTAKSYGDVIRELDRSVRVQSAPVVLGESAPVKRRTVVMIRGTWDTGRGLVDRCEVPDEVYSAALADDAVQRIGVVVYQGLVARELVHPQHVAWIEEV